MEVKCIPLTDNKITKKIKNYGGKPVIICGKVGYK